MIDRSEFRIVDSRLGRVVVPTDSPHSGFLFWTTRDFDGSLDSDSIAMILSTVGELGGSADHLETCRQVHGTRSVEVTESEKGWSECSDCDALWTDRTGIALGIKVADCLPVSVIDPSPDRAVVINAHAGWRGAAAGIVAETIRQARPDGLARSGEARAWLGPSIRDCCFEVGEEVVEAFRPAHPYAEEYVDRSRKKPHLDLAGLVKRSLMEEGIDEDRIWDGGLCTRCPDSLFHSYRRSGPRAGRNLAVAGL